MRGTGSEGGGEIYSRERDGERWSKGEKGRVRGEGGEIWQIASPQILPQDLRIFETREI